MGWGILFALCGVASFVLGLPEVGWPLFVLGGLILWTNRREAGA